MRARGVQGRRRLAGPSRLALAAPLALAAAALQPTPGGTAEIGREVALSDRLADGQEFELATDELIARGRLLFEALWTSQEGGGRPGSKGTGEFLADARSPLVFPRNFNRISGPDANSCAGCHNRPFGIPGGGGEVVANVFVLAQRFDSIDFDASKPRVTGASRDESGTVVTLDRVGNERATTGLFGAGYIEMLAREITEDLRAIRDGIPPGESRALVSKGISFGVLRRVADGRWDTAQVEGLAPQSLSTFGTDDPPSLTVRPFHQAGAVASLREFTINALVQHHGIQSTERFGANSDFDGDGFRNEISRAEISALSLYQATLPVPGRVIPRDPEIEKAVAMGEDLFREVGCAGCHVPRLPLSESGRFYSEPGPYNSLKILQPEDVPALVVDLNDSQLPPPRLESEGGLTWVPIFSDFKLHDITSGPDDPNREPLDMNQPFGSKGFFEGNGRFLTKRLWGAANEAPYFHHGKYTTMREAVLAHAGEAQPVTDAFRELGAHEQDCIVEFLKTLQVLPPTATARVVDEQGAARNPTPPPAAEPRRAAQVALPAGGPTNAERR